MAGMWIGALANSDGSLYNRSLVPQQQSAALESRVRDLEYHIRRLSLLNQALWELLRERAKLTDAELERMVREIDLRDGVEDGAITETPVECPTCGRVSNSKHWKCMYCGQDFEKPIMA